MNEEAKIAKASLASSAILVVIHGLAWMPFFFFMLTTVPAAKRMFADLSVKLGLLAHWVIAWSDWLIQSGNISLAGLFVFLVLDGAILHNLRLAGRTRLAWLWFIFWLLLPLATWLLCWFVIYLPMHELMEALER